MKQELARRLGCNEGRRYGQQLCLNLTNVEVPFFSETGQRMLGLQKKCPFDMTTHVEQAPGRSPTCENRIF